MKNPFWILITGVIGIWFVTSGRATCLMQAILQNADNPLVCYGGTIYTPSGNAIVGTPTPSVTPPVIRTPPAINTLPYNYAPQIQTHYGVQN